jgi:hypothetical protein
MTVNGSLPQPVVDAAGVYTGLWVRSTTMVGLAAGLSGTVATSAVVDAWARLFQPGTHPGERA